jgi:5-methylcytosine-specific restriction protein B
MKTLDEIAKAIENAVGIKIDVSKYQGFLSKRLTKSSSIAKKKGGHGYHIEVTNPAAEMLLFPVVTSSRYETDPSATGEKRRYFLRLEVSLESENLRALLSRCADFHDDEFVKPLSFYNEEKARQSLKENAVIESFTHCTFNMRTTGQRQFEIGTADDGEEFIALRYALWPGDYLIFLQRGPAAFDVLGIPGEQTGDVDISGWSTKESASSVLMGASIGAGIGEQGASSDLDEETERKVREVIGSCERYGHNSVIALAGVPGTGKTYIAEIAARRIAGGKERVLEIQFHSSFTYEEFVEGLRIGPGGQVEVQRGIFLELNDVALADPEHTYVLLIEELTRANLSAVLGELLTYVEHRGRSFQTLYSRQPMRVAQNIRIIATFNPIDRSAMEMDAALLRRLRIIAFPPSREQLRSMLAGNGVPSEVINKLDQMFAACQKKEGFDTGMPFGHGIFAGIKAEMPDLHDLWSERIQHFLYRPRLSDHPFASVIRENYPWVEKSYSTSSDAEQKNRQQEATEGGGSPDSLIKS